MLPIDSHPLPTPGTLFRRRELTRAVASSFDALETGCQSREHTASSWLFDRDLLEVHGKHIRLTERHQHCLHRHRQNRSTLHTACEVEGVLQLGLL